MCHHEVMRHRQGDHRNIDLYLRGLKSMLLVPKVQSITAFFVVKILSTFCVCTYARSKSRLIRKSF